MQNTPPDMFAEYPLVKWQNMNINEDDVDLRDVILWHLLKIPQLKCKLIYQCRITILQDSGYFACPR